jgi:hypothetical protein
MAQQATTTENLREAIKAQIAPVGHGESRARAARHSPSGRKPATDMHAPESNEPGETLPQAPAKTGEVVIVKEIRQAILDSYNEEGQEQSIACRRASMLAELFDQYTADSEPLKAALDLKKSGYAKNSTEYVKLSEVRTIKTFYFNADTEDRNMFTADESIGGWYKRLTWVRARNKHFAEERRKLEFRNEAMKFLKPGLTPAEQQAELEERTQYAIENHQKEQAAKVGVKLLPVSYAAKVVASEWKELKKAEELGKIESAADALVSFGNAIVAQVNKLLNPDAEKGEDSDDEAEGRKAA